ncbi:MAG: thiol reductant ABC exporter subunit CydD [Microbacterium sp.]|uniref:thiol reductant ABC exporter subunit CydD n=1 Tax=Microbacterium sp. TaxID=51671 RepID=UPI0026270D39|nr:thiol reductant ABC exporter subunit CydD [Microbacterium sp.]MCX6502776.1 thiol reductant ABC exporter subunit CydD [Microbacterium sp.]
MSTDAVDAPPRVSNRPIDPRLLRYSTASRGFLVTTAAIVLAQTGTTIGFAYALTRALVGAIEGERVETLLPWVGLGAVLVVLRALLIAAGERTSARGAARASLQLRDGLVRAVEKLGPGWLTGRNSAALAVTAGHGLEALDAYFGRYLPQLVATAVTMPILVLAILVSDPLSGLTVIITMPLIPIFMVLIGMATRAVQNTQYGTLRRLATRFADTVAGLSTLKIYGRQHRAADSMETVTRDYKRETMAVLRVSFLSGFALEFLASISVAIIAVTIGFRLLGGEMPLLVGLFVLLLAPEAYLPLRQVGVQFHAAAEGVAATDEIFDTLDAASISAVADSPAVERAQRDETPGVGERAQLTDRDAPLLSTRGLTVTRGDRLIGPIDLDVRAGEIVLLVGPSGAGKSSLLAALLGFAPADGEIRVTGKVAADARRILSWVGQWAGLMAGTVGQNVALGDAAPEAARIDACLRDARVDVPADLTLGATGSGLSGGQAQRVAIARGLYRLRSGRAHVLVLDEPSSALDAQTEGEIWRMLRAEADSGAGVLLISHRTSARAIADRILTLAPPAASHAPAVVAASAAPDVAATAPARMAEGR